MKATTATAKKKYPTALGVPMTAAPRPATVIAVDIAAIASACRMPRVSFGFFGVSVLAASHCYIFFCDIIPLQPQLGYEEGAALAQAQ